MQVTVAELAKILNGEIIGDPKAVVSKVAKIEEGEPGALSFLSNAKYESFLYETLSSAVIVNRTFIPTKTIQTTLIKVDDAYASFTMLLEKFANGMSGKKGIETSAVVETTATLGKDVFVAAQAYVGANAIIGDGTKIYPQVFIGENVQLGKNCIVYPGVKVYHGCIIGDNCILHAGVVIGSDGFGFAPLPDRSYKKIPQIGIVQIESDVEIGSNTTIDRATMGTTIIRKGVKLDNLVQVAHNCEIGEHTVIAAQTGIAGSTKIGKYCIIGGQVGIGGHLTIADGSIIAAQSGVTGNIKSPNGKWLGFPAHEYSKMIRMYAILKNLPEFEKRLSGLEKSKLNEVK